MHNECNRQYETRLQAKWADDVAIHGLVVPAIESELLELAHLSRIEQRSIEVCQAFQPPATSADPVEVGGCAERGKRKNNGLRTHREIDHLPIGLHERRLSALHADSPQWMLSNVICRRENLLALGREHKLVDRPVPVLSECPYGSGSQIHQDEVKAVSFVLRAVHGLPGEEMAVGRVDGSCVGRQIGRSQIPGLAAAVGRHFEYIEIRRPRLSFALDARSECHALAVGAEVEFLITAPWL